MKNKLKKISQQGSMMVEALAMLGLITMVTPILYKKAAERTTELQDINTATQMRTLSKALDDFIQDNYNDIADGPEGELSIDKADIVPYLPYNFNIDESKLFDEYQFALRNELINAGTDKEHSAITGVVLAPVSADIPMLRASKIASMVGANGGVVRSNEIQGVQGGWSASLGDFGFGNAPDGSLATSSVHAVTSAGGGADSKHVLYRDDSKGDIDYNTMQTTLYMGGFDIEDVEKIIALDGGTMTLDAGDVQATGNLSVSGDADVTGGLTAASADISGLLKAGTAEILGTANIGGALTGGSTATFADKLTVSGGGADITGDAAISGLTTISGGAVVSGAAKKGDAAVTDTENTSYSLVSDGNLLVQANAHVTGDMKIDQALIANSLYGELGIGGGKLSDGNYNFIANADEVSIAGNNFQVGSDADPRLLTTGSQVQAGVGNSGLSIESASASLATPSGAFTLDSQGNTIVDGENSVQLKVLSGSGDITSYLTLDDSNAQLESNNINAVAGNARLAMSNGSARLGLGSVTSDSSGSTSTVYGSNVAFSSTGAVLTGDKGSGVRVPLVSLSGGDITAEGDLFEFNDNFRMDDDDIVFDESAAEPNRGVDNIYNNRSSGVRVMREGIIQLPVGGVDSDRSDLKESKGQQNVPGYIKLDRIIANQAWEEVVAVGSGKHYDANGNPTDNYYDAYQINPAYTSVMHDIKLTTRGGARLSDILPDFINKGIYVLDNTYKEEEGKREWDDYTINPGSGGQPVHVDGPGECTSSDCIASPWLGFVPTPQCPPGYSKVITISPIRWKMAEAYTVAGEVPVPDLSFNEKFTSYFMPVRDPVKVHFELEEVDGSNGLHTHQVVSGWPLTFQTNTWLNTTVSGKRDDGTTVPGGARTDSFLGWHAIMGFLYYANDYQEYLKSLGQNLKDVVIWNLFPVYNEEMTAIANVYCYFERRDMDNPDWKWKTHLVDGGSSGYDQLTNFRRGYNKNNSDYTDRLNDPVLKYDEVW